MSTPKDIPPHVKEAAIEAGGKVQVAGMTEELEALLGNTGHLPKSIKDGIMRPAGGGSRKGGK